MISLLKKWFIWSVGALLIAGSAFFLYPAPEDVRQETAPSAAADEEQKEQVPGTATPADASTVITDAIGTPSSLIIATTRTTYSTALMIFLI